jgi:hypothetical protein
VPVFIDRNRRSDHSLHSRIAQIRFKTSRVASKEFLVLSESEWSQVGDLFMSLIHTCQLCDVNSFDYLAELLRHHRELAANPALWMPWNYREQLPPADL